MPGGLLFANGATYKTLIKPLPRAALARISINDRTVVRGGVGLFSYDLFFDNINQQGFSVGTPVLTTLDNGLTFTGANLTNPIPSGVLVQPVGAALGLASSLGQNLTGNSPAVGGPLASNNLVQPDRNAPYYTRWEFSVQRDFGSGWVLAGTYVGSRGRNLPVFRDVNNIPIRYLSTSRFRDTANETFLTPERRRIRSPACSPGSTINGATVQRQQLLRPFPEFGTFGIEEYTGSDRYQRRHHPGRAPLPERQLVHGPVHALVHARQAEVPEPGGRDARRPRVAQRSAEPPVARLEHRAAVRPRAQVGQRLERRRSTRSLGGWQVSGTYQMQSGFPLTWNASYYDASCGDPMALVSNIGKTVNGKIAGLDTPAWNTSCFYFHDAAVQTAGVDDPVKQRNDQRIQLGNNVRYFPSTLPDVRTHRLHLMDIGLFKNFTLPRSMKLQVRLELINALNYTVLWNPDINPRNSTFGFINQDRNNPRDLQLGLRLTF